MIRAGFDRPNLSFDIVQFEGKGSKARKLAMLLHGLRDEANRPAIVYCGTRKDTEEVAQSLREAGLSAAGYHAGMDPDERASAQHRFMTGDAEVITATNAFGMGVDKANVRSVWHWAIPTSVEAYYQEAGRAGRDGLPARAVLLAGRSDLGRLVRFIQMREVEPESVSLYAQRLKAGSDTRGNLTIDAPRVDEDRVKLAIAERAGAFEVEPAPGGRLELRFNDRIDLAAARAACKAATDRSWRAYRAVESFSFGESCRRRRLLDHFGDSTPGAPEGRCCDVCDPESWLPSPEELEVKAKRRSSKSASPPADLSPEDESLLEALRAWRLKAARGKPAYTVANNRTLEGIAASPPRGTGQPRRDPPYHPAPHAPPLRPPQRRDHRPRRPRQDDARRRHALAVRRVSVRAGRRRAGHGLHGSRAGEGDHDPRQEHGRSVRGDQAQHHRHARACGLRWGGRARADDGRRGAAPRRRLRGAPPPDALRAPQGARGEAAGDPGGEQGRSARCSDRRGGR